MSIELRDNNKARFVVSLGTDSKGKRIKATKVVSYKGKRDLKKQYEEFCFEVKQKRVPVGDNCTLSEMMNTVIASKEKLGVRATTLNGYRVCAARVLDTFGDRIAKRVTKQEVRRWVEGLDYAPKTVKNTLSFLSSCYDDFIDQEILVMNNPCKVKAPARTQKEKVVFTMPEVIRFVQTMHEQMEDYDYIVAYELALFCGLRRSEILGLTNHTIDTVKGRVWVKYARSVLHGEIVIQPPKTESSHRVLALPDFVCEDIRKLQEEHKEFDSEYLILDVWGEPLHPSQLTNVLRKFLKANDLPPVTLHGLRHTYASMLNHLGKDIVQISNQLGHSNKTTTLNIYEHLFEEESKVSRDIADDMDLLINRVTERVTEQAKM